MPQKLGLAPRGLTSLFNLQAFGQQPGQLEDAIRPGVDVTPFMLADRVFHARATGGITARGDTFQIDVPVGELWRPISVGVVWAGATTAGDVVWPSVYYSEFANQNPGGAPALIGTQQWAAAVNVGDIVRHTVEIQNDLLIQSGSAIVLAIDRYNAGGGANFMSLEVLYWKFLV